MEMRIAEGEPAAGPWRESSIENLVRLLVGRAEAAPGRPIIIAVDGRGGSGKTTLASQLCAAVPASGVLHTDDIAWHHSFFDWSELLASNVLEPLRRGVEVRYRPPGWEKHRRLGAVKLPPGLDMVFVEGVGAGRRELMPLLDGIIWVQSDIGEAERRAVDRDVKAGVHGDRVAAQQFWREWMEEELPFVNSQRPWERASVIAAGTRSDVRPSDVVLLASPLSGVGL